MKLNELNLDEKIVETLKRNKIYEATPVQQKSIPFILAGDEVIIQAQTGSGKTLAFAIPIVQKYHETNQRKGIYAIVLTPTRELAKQVAKEFTLLDGRIKVETVYGGVSINPQIKGVQTANIVVGTPGRVLDLLARGDLNISNVTYFVLDEADKMLDMGFLDDVKKIMSNAPAKKKVILLSATMPKPILKIANEFMQSYKLVNIPMELHLDKLKQYYYGTSFSKKLSLVVHEIQANNFSKVIVFCNTIKDTNAICEALKKEKYKAHALNGDLSQAKREKVVEDFKHGRFSILVATDVASRGLHINDIECVINYDLPNDLETYTHRIGRTARIGNEGVAISMVSNYNREVFDSIYRAYSDVLQRKEEPKDLKFINDGFKGVSSRGGDRHDNRNFSRGGNREGDRGSRGGRFERSRGFAENKTKDSAYQPREEGQEGSRGPRREFNRDGPRRDGPREHSRDGLRRDGQRGEFNRDGPREHSRDGPRRDGQRGEFNRDGPRRDDERKPFRKSYDNSNKYHGVSKKRD